MYPFYLSTLAVLFFTGSFFLLPLIQGKTPLAERTGPGLRSRRIGHAPLGHPDHPSFASARRRFVPLALGTGG